MKTARTSTEAVALPEAWMHRRVEVAEILIRNDFSLGSVKQLTGFTTFLKGTVEWLAKDYHREKFAHRAAISRKWKSKMASQWRERFLSDKEELFADEAFIFAGLSREDKEFLYKKVLSMLDRELLPIKMLPKKKNKK